MNVNQWKWSPRSILMSWAPRMAQDECIGSRASLKKTPHLFLVFVKKKKKIYIGSYPFFSYHVLIQRFLVIGFITLAKLSQYVLMHKNPANTTSSTSIVTTWKMIGGATMNPFIDKQSIICYFYNSVQCCVVTHLHLAKIPN